MPGFRLRCCAPQAIRNKQRHYAAKTLANLRLLSPWGLPACFAFNGEIKKSSARNVID